MSSKYFEVLLGDIIDLDREEVIRMILTATSAPKIGDIVVIARKPKMTEPFSDLWDPSFDGYLGTSGKVLDITMDNDPNHPTPQDIAIVMVEHPDGNTYEYPFYCLSKQIVVPNPSQHACSCKTELLITRGCQCGAFTKELQTKKKG